MKSSKLITLVLLVALACQCFGAAAAEPYWRSAGFQSNSKFTKKLWVVGDFTRGAEIWTASAVSLVSPAVTFDVAGKGHIILTANANLTGVRPTGGALYQVITILTGAGSNTMRLDDGTSMSLGGGNITLTEGNDDCLTLMCVSADGDEWRVVALPTTAGTYTTMTASGAITGASIDVTGNVTAGVDGDITNDLRVGQDATVTRNLVVQGTAKIKGAATFNGAITTTNTITAATVNTAALGITGAVTRTAQTYTYTTGKVGATAGWVVAAAADVYAMTVPASQTSSTLVIPVTGLHVGDIITGGNLVGQVESAGGAVQINVELKKYTAAAADLTPATVSDIVRLTSLTADTILSVTNSTLGVLNETVGADETFYFLVTATTAGSTDIALQGAQLTVTQK